MKKIGNSKSNLPAEKRFGSQNKKETKGRNGGTEKKH